MLRTVWKHATAQIPVSINQMGKDYEKIMTYIFQMKSRGKGDLFCSRLFFFFSHLRNSITSLLPTRDKTTLDGLVKHTSKTCGKAGNSAQLEVHSQHHPNSHGVSAKRWLGRVSSNIFPNENVPSVLPPEIPCQGFSTLRAPDISGLGWQWGKQSFLPLSFGLKSRQSCRICGNRISSSNCSHYFPSFYSATF